MIWTTGSKLSVTNVTNQTRMNFTHTDNWWSEVAVNPSCVFYPLFDKNGRLYSFVVNWFRVKYLDENTWYRECSNRNTSENCTKHRQYRPDEAFKIYQKTLKEHKK